MKLHLNDLTVSRLKPPARGQFCVWDASLPSFGIRVGLAAKTFVLKRDNRWHTLGRYPAVSLKDARDEAKRRIALRYFPQRTINARDAIDLYLSAQNLKPSSFLQYRRALENYFPQKNLAAVTLRDITDVLGTLTPSHANLLHSIFKAFLNWCVAHHHLDASPLVAIKKHKLKSRDRLLTDDEVRAIWRESFNHNSFGRLFRCLILSAQRLAQINGFQPAWIRGDTIAFPAHIMKNGDEHVLPLTPLLREHLPGAQLRLHISDRMKALRAALPDIPSFTLHDCRRYFSSTCASLKIPIDITEAILAHKTGSRSQIQRVYDRYNRLEPMRQALDAYEAHLQRVLQSDGT